MARQSGDGSVAGRSVLGGGAGASGLSHALSKRVHLSFHSARLGASKASSEGRLGEVGVVRGDRTLMDVDGPVRAVRMLSLAAFAGAMGAYPTARSPDL